MSNEKPVKYEYFVEEHFRPDVLRARIEAHAAQGFRPEGGVSVTTSLGGEKCYHQAMSRTRPI